MKFSAPEDLQLRRSCFLSMAKHNDPERNFDKMRKDHPHTLASDAYLVGWLAKRIFRDKTQHELFAHDAIKIGFSLKLDALLEIDPKRRPTLAKVVESLIALLIAFRSPLSVLELSCSTIVAKICEIMIVPRVVNLQKHSIFFVYIMSCV